MTREMNTEGSMDACVDMRIFENNADMLQKLLDVGDEWRTGIIRHDILEQLV